MNFIDDESEKFFKNKEEENSYKIAKKMYNDLCQIYEDDEKERDCKYRFKNYIIDETNKFLEKQDKTTSSNIQEQLDLFTYMNDNEIKDFLKENGIIIGDRQSGKNYTMFCNIVTKWIEMLSNPNLTKQDVRNEMIKFLRGVENE